MNRVFKALSDPRRRRILPLLRERPTTAGELAEKFMLTKATMSGYFNVLREAGPVDAERRGTTITYRLQMSVLEDALLGFAESFGFELKLGARAPLPSRIAKREA
ncbi:MAG: metalloregulator ArsR/SmtB family transcription factor [Vicinamibacterales bacterium]|nr:metalloregulator ArsR/SmtB family transcription factor [Vicinamibacterales bacterium]